MILFLSLFFVSGFCSLVYEIVWLRLAMGVFGVTAPFVSIFLSVFMAGLGLGSWGAGRLCRFAGLRRRSAARIAEAPPLAMRSAPAATLQWS